MKEIIEFDLNYIRKYISSTMVLFNNEYDDAYNEFVAVYDLENDQLSSSQIRKLMSNDPDLRFFGVFSPHFQKKSSLLALYSIFEELLKTFCDLVQENLKLKIKPKDLKGNDVEIYYKYLKIVAEINVDELEKEWQEINNYRHIRNCIVHDYANIYESKNKDLLYNIIKSNKHLSLWEDTGELFINHEEYLFNFIELIEKYFKDLIDNYEYKVCERN